MDVKRAVAGVLIGTIVLYVTGQVIFNILFADFYAANAGSATGVPRAERLEWAVIVGGVAYAALITYTMSRRLSSLTVAKGAWIGAVVGFLLWATVDFVFYGSNNLSNLTVTIVDPILEFVHGGMGGAAIAAVLGMMQSSSGPST